MTIYEALIQNIPGQSVPDSHDFELGRPGDDFVVSRDINGNILSRYGDIVWNRTPYSSGDSTHLYFQFWTDGQITPHRTTIVEEIRWIIFLMIWRHPSRRALSTKTLSATLAALRGLARRAEAGGLSISEAVCNRDFMASTPDASSGVILKVLGILQFLGVEVTGFSIAPDALPSLSRAALTYAEAIKQTAPIPTRIYSVILSRLSLEIEKTRAAIDKLVNMYSEVKANPSSGRAATTRSRLGTKSGTTFKDLLQKFDLTEFWATTDAVLGVQGLSRVLSQIQSLLALQIQAYTGMRAEEVRYLPYDCLEEARRDGDARIHYIVKGTVTKLSRGKERTTQWITIEAAAEAIRIAQQLARAIYEAEGKEPNQVNDRKTGSFLFPPVDCDGKGFRLASSINKPSHLSHSASMQAALCPTISEEDQRELYLIDPHRAWSTEAEFAIGSRWHLHTHQLRRSLALYAQSSGLVSLPSLKRQLQHITYEMSLYYAKGSAFSRNFIGELENSSEKHFGEEWQETQPVSQFLAYAATVLLSDESDMFGGHAHWLKIHKRDGNGQIFLDRSETLESFKKGEIAYRPTPIGGCVNPVGCDRTPIHVLSVDCLNTDCKNLIASTKKIEKIITLKTNKIIRLKETGPASAEIRIEEAELKILESGLARARKLSNQHED